MVLILTPEVLPINGMIIVCVNEGIGWKSDIHTHLHNFVIGLYDLNCDITVIKKNKPKSY